MNKNSVILYEGISLIDKRTPIVCIATGLVSSSNRKTGDVIQTWILRQDMLPTEAIKKKVDSAICGDCKFSGGNGCYVNAGQAPNTIYKAYKRGSYSKISKENLKSFKGRVIRLGAYGDIAALPYELVYELVKNCKSHLGYTHSWGKVDDRWKNYLMASVDTPIERALAKDLGYRCFETLQSAKDITEDSVMCPATPEGGLKAKCNTCGLCSGNKVRAKDIAVVLHGLDWKVQRAVDAINK